MPEHAAPTRHEVRDQGQVAVAHVGRMHCLQCVLQLTQQRPTARFYTQNLVWSPGLATSSIGLLETMRTSRRNERPTITVGAPIAGAWFSMVYNGYNGYANIY